MDVINVTVALAADPAQHDGPHGAFVSADAFHNLSRQKDDGSWEQVQSQVYRLTAQANTPIGNRLLGLGKGSVITVGSRFLGTNVWTPDRGTLAGQPQVKITMRVKSLAVVNAKGVTAPVAASAQSVDVGELAKAVAALMAAGSPEQEPEQAQAEQESDVAEQAAEEVPFN